MNGRQIKIHISERLRTVAPNDQVHPVTLTVLCGRNEPRPLIAAMRKRQRGRGLVNSNYGGLSPPTLDAFATTGPAPVTPELPRRRVLRLHIGSAQSTGRASGRTRTPKPPRAS